MRRNADRSSNRSVSRCRKPLVNCHSFRVFRKDARGAGKVTLARPGLLVLRCIDDQDASRKHEAELAYHFERVYFKAVNVRNKDVGGTPA